VRPLVLMMAMGVHGNKRWAGVSIRTIFERQQPFRCPTHPPPTYEISPSLISLAVAFFSRLASVQRATRNPRRSAVKTGEGDAAVVNINTEIPS